MSEDLSKDTTNQEENHEKSVLDLNSKVFHQNIHLPTDFEKQIANMVNIAREASKVYVPIIKLEIPKIYFVTTQFAEVFRQGQLALSESISRIVKSGVLDSIQKITESVGRLTDGIKSHFPDNWPSNGMDKCDDLCIQGVPIVFIPRKDIVTKIINAKNMTGIKQVLWRNDQLIIEDCETIIMQSNWLSRDMKDQIVEGIESYKDGRYRAAQSTANVAFDSLLNEIIDIRAWRKTNTKPKQLSHAKVKQLTNEFSGDILELPMSRAPFYTLLMFPIIGEMLSPFEIGDKTTYAKDFNRHMSAHTVAAKQYIRTNALLALMVVSSICKVTQLRGKNWMQTSAKEYGIDI